MEIYLLFLFRLLSILCFLLLALFIWVADEYTIAGSIWELAFFAGFAAACHALMRYA
jgi:hypothetical protein